MDFSYVPGSLTSWNPRTLNGVWLDPKWSSCVGSLLLCRLLALQTSQGSKYLAWTRICLPICSKNLGEVPSLSDSNLPRWNQACAGIIHACLSSTLSHFEVVTWPQPWFYLFDLTNQLGVRVSYSSLTANVFLLNLSMYAINLCHFVVVT